MTRVHRIHPADGVAVAIDIIRAGDSIDVCGARITARSGMPPGHKIALIDIPAGSNVIKYGHPIGAAAADIRAGEHVHTHNLKTSLREREVYSFVPRQSAPEPIEPGFFNGFLRSGGGVGVRNEIWIVPTVGCVNSIGEAAARAARGLTRGSVGGVYCFPHPYGCSQLGDDHENTKKILLGLIRHPNAGGALILGLGCENNGADGIRTALGDYDETRIKFLNCQDVGDELVAAGEFVNELIETAASDVREKVPVSKLTVGLKCGGSDGLSGITANPLAGSFTDRLVAEGGSAILTEVPEMFGAETILMSRCANEETFDKTVSLINDFKKYFTGLGLPVYENPSPGNKDGGITTLEEKALGCTQKAGSAAVNGVLAYGEAIRGGGLHLLNSPGNDLVASTALAASGAQLILFTTGRGTPLGAPAPVIKISSNTALYSKKFNWIDFDAGPLAGGVSIDEMTDALYSYVLRVASGAEQTKTERNGIRDMAVWKNGVTL